MSEKGKSLRGLLSALGRKAAGFLQDNRANVIATVALMAVPVVGMVGMAGEASSWLFLNRSMQNASDAAVVAAANQGLQDSYSGYCSSGTCYVNTGKTVTSRYGYTDGVKNTSVAVTQIASASCPTTASQGSGMPCYKVVVQRTVPIYLVNAVGYGGNSNGAQLIQATAIAGAVQTPASLCLLALGSDVTGNSPAVQFNGSSHVNFTGCPVGAFGNMGCTGSNLGAPYGVATGTDGTNPGGQPNPGKTCGNVAINNATITNPYAALASSIPANQCTGHPYTGATLTGTTFSGSYVASGSTTFVCGDLTLNNAASSCSDNGGSTVCITGNDQVWVIENGVLNLNGSTLQTSGAGLTVIWTSPNSASIPAAVTGGTTGYISGAGTMDISSPTSGTWSGVTLYQDPTPWGSSGHYSMTYNGNSSGFTWDLSGAVYLPNADMVLNGAISKASSGFECFVLVTDQITSNGGSGNLFNPNLSNPSAQCGLQGVNPPTATGYRYVLVG